MVQYKKDFESHSVTTADGYTLTLLKVPKRIQCDRPPVLIVHGLISAGTHWCMNSPQRDLPYKLANEGYDCWLANLRGTSLSKSHVRISPHSKRFWDFSWHEMGLYDLPAMINYILKESGSEQLSYIGHSMGCAVFFAAMALRPELNKRVNTMIALAPSVYGGHIRNKLARLSIPFGNFLGRIRRLYSREIFPMTLIAIAKKVIPLLTLNALSPERVAGWVLRTCATRTGVMGSHQVEKYRMSHIAGELPSPTSLKTFCHGTQCFNAGKFQHYDYGQVGNYKKYGEPTPPEYDLTKTTVPVATFYSIGDQLCSAEDVAMLAKSFPNLIGNFQVGHGEFAHTDFMFGRDADTLVYEKVIDILDKRGINE